MPRYSKDHVPKYRLHKQSGQAIVTIGDRDHLLGKRNSPGSRQKYNQLIARWFSAGRSDAGFVLRPSMPRSLPDLDDLPRPLSQKHQPPDRAHPPGVQVGSGEAIGAGHRMDALRTVAGLKKGRSDAKERAAVHAVSELQVFDVIAKASRIIGAMIDLQLITGMRSGEW